tara:strand:- start:39635 stop:40474 length:840 start_codon:yes stop_codon:yes gene_type:complete
MKQFLFLIPILFTITSTGQTVVSADAKESTWDLFTYDFGNIFKSVGYSYTRPLQWQGKQWLQLGGVAAGVGAVYLFDVQTSDIIRDTEAHIPDLVKEYGEVYGAPQYNYLATSGVYLTGLFTHNEKLRRTGVLLIASATSVGVLQQLTKSLVGRARPVANQGKAYFDPFNSDRNYHSFPSGHAMLAFTNAYAIGKQFKNPWVKSGIYVVGLIPGVSRIWDGQHWLSDVALGVAISIFTVESIDRYLDAKYDEKYNDPQDKKLSWDLSIAPGQMGITVHF